LRVVCAIVSPAKGPYRPCGAFKALNITQSPPRRFKAAYGLVVAFGGSMPTWFLPHIGMLRHLIAVRGHPALISFALAGNLIARLGKYFFGFAGH
jgi:hypothetical protein